MPKHVRLSGPIPFPRLVRYRTSSMILQSLRDTRQTNLDSIIFQMACFMQSSSLISTFYLINFGLRKNHTYRTLLRYRACHFEHADRNGWNGSEIQSRSFLARPVPHIPAEHEQCGKREIDLQYPICLPYPHLHNFRWLSQCRCRTLSCLLPRVR